MDLHGWLYEEPDTMLHGCIAVNKMIDAGLDGWHVSHHLRDMRNAGSAWQYPAGSWYYSGLELQDRIAEALER